jgi:hypothetical protein
LAIFKTDFYPFSPQDSDIFEWEVFQFPIRLNFLSSLGATAGLPILIKIGSVDCATLTRVNSGRGQGLGRRISLTKSLANHNCQVSNGIKSLYLGKLLPEWHTATHYQIRPEVDAEDTDTLAAHC